MIVLYFPYNRLSQEYVLAGSHYQSKSLPINRLSQVIKEYVPVVSQYQSKSLPITKSFEEMVTLHALLINEIGWRKYSRSRPSTPPIFDRLQYAKMEGIG